jgi:hypothetical protein
MTQLIEVQKNEFKLKGELFEYKLKVKDSEERLREPQNEVQDRLDFGQPKYQIDMLLIRLRSQRLRTI